MTLWIGRLDDDFVRIAKSALPREMRRGRNAAWLTCRKEIDIIENLNLASVCAFTGHVGSLEGLTGDEAIDRTKFRNMPWWMCSIWLPVQFDLPQGPAKDSSGWPVFVGSCQQLLAELTEVQRLSKMGLGKVPDGYSQMRTDMKSFVRSEFSVKGNRAVMQWVWYSLFEAATIAIRENVPVLGTFD